MGVQSSGTAARQPTCCTTSRRRKPDGQKEDRKRDSDARGIPQGAGDLSRSLPFLLLSLFRDREAANSRVVPASRPSKAEGLRRLRFRNRVRPPLPEQFDRHPSRVEPSLERTIPEGLEIRP